MDLFRKMSFNKSERVRMLRVWQIFKDSLPFLSCLVSLKDYTANDGAADNFQRF